MAELAIIQVGKSQLGALDVALAVMLVITIWTLSNWRVGVAAVIAQLYLFKVGLFIATIAGIPLPGSVFVLTGAAPFAWYLKGKWREMPGSDKKQIMVVFIICSLVTIAGVLHAFVIAFA